MGERGLAMTGRSRSRSCGGWGRVGPRPSGSWRGRSPTLAGAAEVTADLIGSKNRLPRGRCGPANPYVAVSHHGRVGDESSLGRSAAGAGRLFVVESGQG